jgi:hypothetical protein
MPRPVKRKTIIELPFTMTVNDRQVTCVPADDSGLGNAYVMVLDQTRVGCVRRDADGIWRASAIGVTGVMPDGKFWAGSVGGAVTLAVQAFLVGGR